MRFRVATREDVPAVVALLRDDVLGAAREGEDMAPYLAAFGRIEASPDSTLIVGEEEDGRIVATYHLSVLPGLSRGGASRALVEGVRVAADRRSQGIGARMMRDAEDRARTAGCVLIELTTDRSRRDAHRFYEGLGFTPSHIGFKRELR